MNTYTSVDKFNPLAYNFVKRALRSRYPNMTNDWVNHKTRRLLGLEYSKNETILHIGDDL